VRGDLHARMYDGDGWGASEGVSPGRCLPWRSGQGAHSRYAAAKLVHPARLLETEDPSLPLTICQVCHIMSIYEERRQATCLTSWENPDFTFLYGAPT
jgi:hypothetical protein